MRVEPNSMPRAVFWPAIASWGVSLPFMLFISHDLKPFLQTNSFEAHAKSIGVGGLLPPSQSLRRGKLCSTPVGDPAPISCTALVPEGLADRRPADPSLEAGRERAPLRHGLCAKFGPSV